MASGGKSTIKRDHYMVLGIPPTASRETIKRAYRDRVKQFHPDLNPDDPARAEERTKELTDAYDVVSNLTLRKEYDSQPQFQLRIPRDFQKAGAGSNSHGGGHSSLWGKLRGMFSTAGGSRDKSRNTYEIHFSAGVTCAQFPGGKMLHEAEVDFERAVQLNGRSVEALYNLGLVYYWQGRFAEAAARFKAVLEAAPDDSYARRILELLQGYDEVPR